MMMALRNSPSEYALINALGNSHPPRPWRRGAMIAIGASVLLHAGLFTYLYLQRVSVPAVETPSDHAISISRTVLTPPRRPPTATTQPKRQAISHPTAVDTNAPPPRTTSAPQTPQTAVTSIGPTTFDPQFTQITPPQPPSRLIVDPKWLSQPSAAEMSRFYPAQAIDQGVTGTVTLMCGVVSSGKLVDCRVITETPAGARFGDAALKLAAFFRMTPRTVDGQPVDGALTRISLTFRLTGGD